VSNDSTGDPHLGSKRTWSRGSMKHPIAPDDIVGNA
jgi:hypothetical protein